ncbi:hypothetical protein PspLS_07992 [Pyricularia sp. CBS 133598]|nr:hypothetical protein PspLS_07992 [Pyricularia sp. CBS 133598]
MRLNLIAALLLVRILVQAVPIQYESDPRYETSAQHSQDHTHTSPVEPDLGALEEHAIERRFAGLVRVGATLLKPVLKSALNAAAKKLKPVVKPALKRVAKTVAKPVAKTANKIISEIKPKKSTSRVGKPKSRPKSNNNLELPKKKDVEPNKKTSSQPKSKPAPQSKSQPKKDSPKSKQNSKSTKPVIKPLVKPQSSSDITPPASKHEATNMKPKSKLIPSKDAPSVPPAKKPTKQDPEGEPKPKGKKNTGLGRTNSSDLPSDQSFNSSPIGGPIISDDPSRGQTPETPVVDLPQNTPQLPPKLPSAPPPVLVNITNNSWISSSIADSFRMPLTPQKTYTGTPHPQDLTEVHTNTKQQPTSSNIYNEDDYSLPRGAKLSNGSLGNPEQLVSNSPGLQEPGSIDSSDPVTSTYDGLGRY